MILQPIQYSALDLLSQARFIADHALSVGFAPLPPRRPRATTHIGAALADAILQAGVNYRTVVQPRIDRILVHYPECQILSGTIRIIERDGVEDFLLWNHREKVERFIRLHCVLRAHHIEDVTGLRAQLETRAFQLELLKLKGIGGKTVDYLSCLVGIDTVAVDRHVRRFAAQAGVRLTDYERLQAAFCYAADLLSSSRRGFDAWIWKQASLTSQSPPQYDLFPA